MLHDILILVNSYKPQLQDINKQFLNKYVYNNTLYFKCSRHLAYNWRHMRSQYSPDTYDTIYTLRDNYMDLTSAVLPLRMRF